MPYETGSPKCRNFGMSDSAKYPGLCKPYEVEQNSGNKYADLGYNSINSQQIPTYYTYKTYNTQYDNQRMVGSSSSTRNNVQSSPPHRDYSANSNNEVHSYSSRQEVKTTNQQQYGNQPNSQSQPTQNRYQMSPFQQAFTAHQQQNLQKRTLNKTNPFHTYRWDLLFKNYLWKFESKKNFVELHENDNERLIEFQFLAAGIDKKNPILDAIEI